MSGKKNIFAVFKPRGITSNQVLNLLRRNLKTKKIGHAGTLDPLAEGVLVVGIGRGTKYLHDVVGQEKEYAAEIHFGVRSKTDDAEGPLIPQKVVAHPKQTDLLLVLKKFEGKIMQRPPVYSAIKIRGQEAYKRVRKGESVVMRPRLVEIRSIQLLHYRWPLAKIRIVCGKGVYIRSLGRDIGKALGVGAYLSGLTRTRVGEFRMEESLKPDELHTIFKPDEA